MVRVRFIDDPSISLRTGPAEIAEPHSTVSKSMHWVLKIDPSKLQMVTALTEKYEKSRICFVFRYRGEFKNNSGYLELLLIGDNLIFHFLVRWISKIAKSGVQSLQISFARDFLTFYLLSFGEHYESKAPNRDKGRDKPISWPAHMPDLTPSNFYL